MIEKNKHGIIINTNLLISVLLLLLAAYSNYIIRSFEIELQKQYQMIYSITEKLHETNKKVTNHLGWHRGKKEKNNYN